MEACGGGGLGSTAEDPNVGDSVSSSAAEGHRGPPLDL